MRNKRKKPYSKKISPSRKEILKVLPIPVPKEDHPEPPNDVLMKHEFTIGLIAPKGKNLIKKCEYPTIFGD